MRFLIDEDIPRSSLKNLIDAGFEAVDVRDIGLRGKPDNTILEYAINNKAVVITADIGFAGVAYLLRQKHFGLVLMRIANETTSENFNRILVNALKSLNAEDICGNIVVVEQDKIRIRTKSGIFKK